jgi:hypothetical protein
MTDTSPGDCTITLIAESNVINGEASQQEWQGRANVKWSGLYKLILLYQMISEIIFESLPDS